VTESARQIHSMLRKADRKLAAAERLLETGDWEDASSRSYYAVFHAISAVLWKDGKSFSSHAQTLGTFNRDYVRAGAFPEGFTRILNRLFKDRQKGDYDFLFPIEEQEARDDVRDAREVVRACSAFLEP